MGRGDYPTGLVGNDTIYTAGIRGLSPTLNNEDSREKDRAPYLRRSQHYEANRLPMMSSHTLPVRTLNEDFLDPV